ncbi:MAG: hypothetical protein ACLQIQ_19225, partial [Beijerinckiaceae bacterium]
SLGQRKRVAHIPTAEAEEARSSLNFEGQEQARLHLKSKPPWSQIRGPLQASACSFLGMGILKLIFNIVLLVLSTKIQLTRAFEAPADFGFVRANLRSVYRRLNAVRTSKQLLLFPASEWRFRCAVTEKIAIIVQRIP